MAIDATGVNIGGFGYQTKETISASTLTTDLNDSGKVLDFTATCVVTLHAVAAGETLTLRVGAPGIDLTVDPAAADKIQGCDAAGADGKYIKFSSQPVGSFVKLVGGNADGWVISAVSGTFTAE